MNDYLRYSTRVSEKESVMETARIAQVTWHQCGWIVALPPSRPFPMPQTWQYRLWWLHDCLRARPGVRNVATDQACCQTARSKLSENRVATTLVCTGAEIWYYVVTIRCRRCWVGNHARLLVFLEGLSVKTI